jgi:hypothetical protein
MRIVDDPAGVLDGTFARSWLTVRKRPGKICRRPAVSAPPENGSQMELTQFH